MTKLLAIAALLLATTAAAQAQYSFDYGGRTIRVDPDRGTVSIPGVYDNTGEPPRRAKRESTERKRKPAPAQEAKSDPKSDPQAAPATSSTPATPPAAPGQTAVPAAPPPAATPPAKTTVAVTPPAETEAATPPPAPPIQQQDAAPPPPPAVAAIPPAATPRPAANPVLANSPVGIWLTEEKEGKVRIEQCGANLCGYAVDKKTSQNREQILINMKPGKDKWSGRIFDPNSGSNYDSTIALKGPDTLRVQGCAFGGMFCGGQTWTRVN